MRKTIIAALALVTLLVPAQVEAKTYRTPEGALKAKLRKHGIVIPRAACDRLTSRRWLCDWDGDQPFAGKCWGTAIVTHYQFGWLAQARISPASDCSFE